MANPTFNLHVKEGTFKVVDWNRYPDNLGHTPEGQIKYENVSTPDNEDPEIDDTYNGSVYTRRTRPDYFCIQSDQGDDLPDRYFLVVPAGTSKTIRVQKKDGVSGEDKVGSGETIIVRPEGGVIKVDKALVTLDTDDGAEDVTFGPFASDVRGCVPVLFKHEAMVFRSRRIFVDVVDP